jgi:hypothetical protein
MEQLRLFMQHHVFAVWDFMLLLKALQQQLAPACTPWLPPRHPGLAGLINSLVAEEECDCLPPELGGPLHLSHFAIYRLAMEEVGAETQAIDAVLQQAASRGLAAALAHPAIPQPSRRFMGTTHELIGQAQPHLLAAAFAYGRELLVPDLFRDLLRQIQLQGLPAPLLVWYLERHIALDTASHGPLAETMVVELCQERQERLAAVDSLRRRVIRERELFWDSIADRLRQENPAGRRRLQPCPPPVSSSAKKVESSAALLR